MANIITSNRLLTESELNIKVGRSMAFKLHNYCPSDLDAIINWNCWTCSSVCPSQKVGLHLGQDVRDNWELPMSIFNVNASDTIHIYIDIERDMGRIT